MERDKTDLIELYRFKNQIEDILADRYLSADKNEFYSALKTVIDIKISEQEVVNKFDKLQEVFTNLAVGDFNQRIDIPNRKNLFSFLSAAFNSVIEELEVNVVKKQYLEIVLEFIPFPAIITDKGGAIRYINSKAVETISKTKEQLINLRIANIFESKTQFGISDPAQVNIEDVLVNIVTSSHSVSVRLTVKEIPDKVGRTDGYLYIGKPVHE